MKNTISYNGYHATIEYSAEDNMLIGQVIGVNDSLNFHGTTVSEVTESFHNCIDEYLEMCKAIGKDPDKEFKGTFNVRLTPQLHRKAAIAAESNGITLNQFVQMAIEKQVSPTPKRFRRRMV